MAAGEPRIFDLDEQKVLDDGDIERLQKEQQEEDAERGEVAEKAKVAEAVFSAMEGKGKPDGPAEDDDDDSMEEFFDDEGMKDPKKNEERTLCEKEQGNEAFKAGEYEKACEHWRKSLRSCRFIMSKDVYPEGDARREEILELMKVSNLNLAMGQLKLKNFSSAVEYCDQVLEKDSVNVKALFRKASALYERGDTDAAVDCVDDLLALEPENAAARQLRAKCVVADQKFRAKQKRMMKQVMGNLETDPRSLIIGPKNHGLLPGGVTDSVWGIISQVLLPISAVATVVGSVLGTASQGCRRLLGFCRRRKSD